MGQTFAQGFPELLPFMGPVFAEGRRSGRAQDVNEAPMMVERNGYREEAFFTGNFTPLRGDSGLIEGFYNSLFEVTDRVIADRRTRMLNLMATPGDPNVKDAYSHIISSLETNPLDIPMAIIYEADTTSVTGKTVLHLRGSLGIPEGHGLLLDGYDIDHQGGILPLCHQAKSGPIAVQYDERFDGLDWLGFNQPSDKIATVPITTGKRLFGFITIGTNPCRPYNGLCEQFVQDLARVASSIITSATDVDFLRKRQQQLESDLALSDMKIRHLVQHASVGMVHARNDGTIAWANENFFAVAGNASKDVSPMVAFYDGFLPEDQPKAKQVWDRVLMGEPHASAELRLKRLYIPPIGDPEPAYVQILAFPYKEDGVTLSGMACTTDISRLKWAEAWQTRLAQDAKEAKRQQEAYIDVVSHEMRNPLSAIVHCADSISTSLHDLQTKIGAESVPDVIRRVLEENVALASIITKCTNHQKRIIDDVLDLGRLDSSMLSITPGIVHPSRMVTSIVSLFESELRSNLISTTVTSEPSIAALNVDHVYLDESRVTQVFINLLTNAIKFIKLRENRKIEIRFGARLSSPQDAEVFPKDTHWASKGEKARDPTSSPDWGPGETLYLAFSLLDTGIGITHEETVQIFQRFQQANVKTHATYGGSGLGLFISKELTEMMGGEIGVLSNPGHGSLFAFYVKTRRVSTRVQIPHRPIINGATDTTIKELKVLLVEDNVINQTVLRKHLEKAGCTVRVANHGVEALDLIRKHPGDISAVLMDVQMPVMDGLTCTIEIRRLEQEGELEGHLPIIAVTANVREEQRHRALAAGAVRGAQIVEL